MSGRAQLRERDGVVTTSQPEGDASAPGLTQAQQQAIAANPIVLIDELATLLGTSVRTLERQLRAGTFFIPELPKIDHRHRWSRQRVYLAIAETTLESHRRSLLGPRGVAPRTNRSEGARERSTR